MIDLTLPIDEKSIRKLKVGDEVSLNGRLVTGRDAAHDWLVKERPDSVRDFLKNTMIYHCGPVVKKRGNDWEFVAAGPTTSIREEPYQGTVIQEYGLRGVIGKGGMGPQTLKALEANGAVYLHAIGGLATLIAESVVKVHTVFKLEEFGVPEAMWVIDVRDFPAVVTMDSHGGSLHEKIFRHSDNIRKKLLHIDV
ncbi:MAG: fumarate hydratase subunit beta [Candidatus Marinimicrobia bacterium]|jgi:fumarate hydratase class I|nr:fumarate hydratase subunit beta [Candidatus Neomarinimicrobiota bacterium]